jgi:hypothetical protein
MVPDGACVSTAVLQHVALVRLLQHVALARRVFETLRFMMEIMKRNIYLREFLGVTVLAVCFTSKRACFSRLLRTPCQE